jgi:hypothetical protein
MNPLFYLCLLVLLVAVVRDWRKHKKQTLKY